jgi:endonuclease/exonuclease/phosphatase family metal-dependent hydrolase
MNHFRARAARTTRSYICTTVGMASVPRRAFLLAALLLSASSACAVDTELDADDEESTEEPVSADSAAVTGPNLRVMTYNIKYGIDSGLDLSKIADVIKASNPDVVALQEVDEGTRRSGRKNQTAELSSLTKMRYRYFGANFDFDGGKYGLAILSKYPLSNKRVIRLDRRTQRGGGYEPRIAAAADVNVRGDVVTFVTLHASLHKEERDGNARALLAAIGARAPRTIVAGDLNETPGKDIGSALGRAGFADAFRERHRFALGFTAPARVPVKRIDFIYRGRSFGKTAHAWVPNTRASDHRPVAAVVPLR